MNNYAKNVISHLTMQKNSFKELVKALFFIIIFICFAWLITNPEAVSNLSEKGAVMAVLSVMPSTFPYLVLSGLMIKSGMAELIGRLITPLAKFYKLPPSAICTVFISLISGFPVPSSMGYSLYREDECTIFDGEHITGFCSFCGPPFIISLFGVKIMNDLGAGVLLFSVQAVLSLIFGKILAVTKRRVNISNNIKNKKSTEMPLGVLICKSITEGGMSMLKILSFVIFFAIFSGFCENLILSVFPSTPDIIISLLKGFLEMSSGVSSLIEMDISERLKFILGGLYIYWSGLSVFFQVSSSTEGVFSMKKYLLGRVFMILLGVPISYFIYFYIMS